MEPADDQSEGVGRMFRQLWTMSNESGTGELEEYDSRIRRREDLYRMTTWIGCMRIQGRFSFAALP